MKTLKNLYNNLLDKNKIKDIIILASKGKKKRREVQKVLDNIDEYADKILEMLQNGSYYMLPSRNKEIDEKGKTRLLTISPFFPNRILDYIIVETLKPFIRKSMYEYCIGNVDKRGMVYGKKVIAKRYRKYKYYIKLDIHHFYPSVTSQRLFDFLQTKIRDKKVLDLCKCVVMAVNDMPIGSYYSQWFSNWFLQELDHLIKEKWKVAFYVRYVDDMLLMGNNKKTLLNAMYNIERWLNEKGLQLKRHEQPKTVEQQPIDFLGFRFSQVRMCLRLRNFKALNKRVRKIRKNKNVSLKQAQSLMSYLGWLKQIKIGYLYYINHIKQVVTKGLLRHIISRHAVA